MNAPPLPGSDWTPLNVLYLILGIAYGIGLLYLTIGHRDNKKDVQAAKETAQTAVTLSGQALAAKPGPASSASLPFAAELQTFTPPAIDPAALQALKDELTAHAEALKQSISSTPLTATLMGQITAGDLAAAHEQIAKAQETPVPAPAEAAQPFPAPAGVIAPPPAV